MGAAADGVAAGVPPGKYVWKDEYAIGVRAIDEQHRPIIDLLNGLLQPIAAIDLASVAQRSLRYTQTHFACEEALMLQHGYPGHDGHKAQHEAFVNQLRAYVANRDDNAGKAMARMILVKWFVDHITSNAMDRKLGAYLNARGVG